MTLKSIGLTSALLIGIALLAPAICSTQAAEGRLKVYLKIESRVEGKHAYIQITNSTSNKIPKDTKIYWQITQFTGGSFILPFALSAGDSYRFRIEMHLQVDSDDKAWYFK